MAKLLSARLGGLVAAAVGFVAVPSLAADTGPSLDLRGFDPPAAPLSGLHFEPASSPATLDFNAAMWTSYSYRPVILRDSDDEVAYSVVGHQLSGDIIGNFGLFERAALGFQLPYVLFQSGDDPSDENGAAAVATLGSYSLPSQALGDLKLLAKITLVKPTSADLGGFALALHERFSFPTGDEASYLGEGHVQSETRLLAEYDLIAASFHLSAGVKLRAEQGRFGCAGLDQPSATGEDGETVPSAEPDCPTTFGHEMPFGFAINVRPRAFGLDDGSHWNWFAEAYGYVPLHPAEPFNNAALSQVQLGGGARYSFDNDVSLLAGVDAAVVGGVGNPTLRATFALAWAPRKHDQDDDGVTDRGDKDMCPDIPEDIDGHEDDDGCPDWDNDGDSVPDKNDRCDGEKEDKDDYQDGDGCPDPDNDGDKILDVDDHCPDVVGIPSDDPTQRGCPDRDPDKDGVEEDADKCPQEAEDPDGFEDADGCPDPDNDADGFNDSEDGCPDLKGMRFGDGHEDNGCPDTDADGITDGKDACPAEPGLAAIGDPAKHGCPAPVDEDDGKKKVKKP